MTLIDPSDDKGNQGQPKQQKKVCPEYLAVNVRRRVQHVMMIVPKDADIQEAERVGEKARAAKWSVSPTSPAQKWSHPLLVRRRVAAEEAPTK